MVNMDTSAILGTSSISSAASLANAPHLVPGGSALPLLDSRAAIDDAPSPSPQALRADSDRLPLAIAYAPSGAPLDALRAIGFEGVA
jgi:hypothetical protein